MSKIELPATISSLPKALDFFREEGATHGLGENAIYQMEIALEEALVNIMLYAYPEPSPEHTFTLEILGDAKECRLIITDSGIAFDPTAHVPDTDIESEDRDVGGLGIFFIYKYADRVEYVRLGNTNQLTLFRGRSTN